MSVQTTINPEEKLLSARFTGKITLEDCRDILLYSIADSLFEFNYNRLVYLTEAQYSPRTADIADSSKLIAAMQKTAKEGLMMDAFLALDSARVWLRRK